MTNTQLDSLSCREQIYRLLAESYRFPDPQRTRELISGSTQHRLRQLGAQIGFQAAALPALTLNPDEYEVQFIALHEVGMGGAPCPLHSGHYARDRMKTMEEVLRFYRFFHYSPDRSADRFPDHLGFELEFMAHLLSAERSAMLEDGDSLGPLLAQRDFLDRNLFNWVANFRTLVERHARHPFFSDLAGLLEHFITFEHASLEQQVFRQSESQQGRPIK